MRFVRFRSPTPNSRGARVGIFALANGLRADARLDDTDAAWLAENNAWYSVAYPEPGPGIFDRAAHPITEWWFRASASHLIARVDGYLNLLDRHGVPWERAESDDPGTVIYEDSVQLVVAPHRAAATAASPRY